MLGMSHVWIIRKCSGVYQVPPCLGWSLAVSSRRRCLFLASYCQLAGAFL